MTRFVTLVLLFVCVCAGVLSAQETGVIYYDRTWAPTDDPETAMYVRHWERVNDTLYHVKDGYASTGVVQMKGYSTDYKEMHGKTGEYRYFHGNTQLLWQVSYVAGQRHGKTEWWYATGERMDSGTFDNGARTGRWIGWYPNGQKRSEGEYVANRRVGEWTEWYPNGQVESTGKYYRGLPNGIHKTYHSNGALARELENFAPGIGTAKTYDRDGTLRGEEQIVNDTVRVGKYFRDDEEFADMSQAYVRPFPVGMEDKDDLFEYLDENLKYPEISRRAGHGGEVAITLHIDEDGNLVDAYVSHSATPALDEAALNVARTLTKWRPARIGNRESYYVFTLPIGFKLVD